MATTPSRLERWMQALLHIHDTPRRTAAAFGLGVAIGFGPFVGLHTLIGLSLAFLFNLNRVAVLAGLWVNLPWIMAPYYTAVTAFGAWVTDAQMPPNFLGQLRATWDLPTWRERMEDIARLIKPLFIPYTIGSTIAAVPIGLVTYRSALAFIRARHKHHRGQEQQAPPTDSHSA